jgi:predicted  nucleic acid-binding Zn-ribbon protein
MSISRRPIQPKLRSMPLRKSPSALYIQMHQLANEKERLQEELVRVSDRQQQIVTRLAELDRNLAQLDSDVENNAVSAEMSEAQFINKIKANPKERVQIVRGVSYDSMTIEY